MSIGEYWPIAIRHEMLIRLVVSSDDRFQILQSSLFDNIVDNILHIDEQNITSTITNLLYSLDDDFYVNKQVNDTYLPTTYQLTKKFILLSNFYSEHVSKLVFDRSLAG